eukprot:GHVL01007311.1.p1 GENE.GHVL01007311.1~~GHVL01007311.1.p1  ORF type:complete len:264 (+),score=82.41 GHVL01007311.1:253-1044(+)
MKMKLSRREMLKIGLPCDRHDVVERAILDASGTYLATQLALKYGIGLNLGGGTHHAHRDQGRGYTIFNDVAITSLIYNKILKNILIIDLDVHQGDGTAQIINNFYNNTNNHIYENNVYNNIYENNVYNNIYENNNNIYTVSFHCKDNYPWPKISSYLDISFNSGDDDNIYLKKLYYYIPKLLYNKPCLVLYIAGIDVHKNDKLGLLNLSNNCIYIRDYYIIKNCISNNIPIACLIGGGYQDNIQELIRRHCIIYEAAYDAFKK